MRKQITSLAALAAAGILGYAAPANAVLVLTADVGGVLFSCADQAACDNNPTVG